MGKVKNYKMAIEELVWTAIELGARDLDSIYAYVYMYERRVTPSDVEDVLAKYKREEDAT